MKTPYLSITLFGKPNGPLSKLGKAGLRIFVAAISLFLIMAIIDLISFLSSHEWWENREITPTISTIFFICFLACHVGVLLILTDKIRSEQAAK